MRILKYLLYSAGIAIGLSACAPPPEEADAYGNFEATEILVAAESSGKILQLDVEEGGRLSAGQQVGLIDTVPLHLKRRQLEAAIRAIRLKTQDAQPQIAVLEEQKANLQREQRRFTALVQDSAATPKQLDDITGQLEVIDQQIAAAQSQTNTINRGILAEIGPLEAQLDQINDQITRSYLYNPINGTVLLKMAEASEMAAAGKPLYKIADLEELTLRAYVTGDQLALIRIGQQVKVGIDQQDDQLRYLDGTITWIAQQAEFTPKIIQTRNERVNLVYAIKILVANDGALKIGMPAEVQFTEKPIAHEGR